MSANKIVLAISIAAVTLFPMVTSAQSYQRRYAPGHAVRVQQRINQASPGTTRQLSPDSKQSATGGQAGGQVGQE